MHVNVAGSLSMEWPFGIEAFVKGVDNDIESVVEAALAILTSAGPAMNPDNLPADSVLLDVVIEKACPEPISVLPLNGPPEAVLARLGDPVPEIEPDVTAARPAIRTRVERACVNRARQRIQETLEWENCDEESSHFLAVAQEFDDAFNKEELEDGEMDEVSGSESLGSDSQSDDDESYESSFVTDGSGSEDECSEDEWTPQKKKCVSHEAEVAASSPRIAVDSDVSVRAYVDSPKGEDITTDATTAGFLHMEAFDHVTAEDLDHVTAIDVDHVTAVDGGGSVASASFLHAEELNSPEGFYNLWVL